MPFVTSSVLVPSSNAKELPTKSDALSTVESTSRRRKRSVRDLGGVFWSLGGQPEISWSCLPETPRRSLFFQRSAAARKGDENMESSEQNLAELPAALLTDI